MLVDGAFVTGIVLMIVGTGALFWVSPVACLGALVIGFASCVMSLALLLVEENASSRARRHPDATAPANVPKAASRS